ncbi:hypothetical protein EIN_173450 [Entamoeba invadens IP1]|uniref:TLDc domain-containing protein n=1 Tax=Entamoeba invadens IP1 TaxID=370355 RepID=A0A0A1TYN0_ENTIV|nr:hypothetical protein EIN_173450 [Entamoeba invadens IP1]ELP84670.1 hypothetical protein EIN_173450 [Entamoeba invadens IP1]|eukprot:XP_004184016.1 hypothetical protein EIN_173450 [Entamoeba invadens IP1]
MGNISATKVRTNQLAQKIDYLSYDVSVEKEVKLSLTPQPPTPRTMKKMKLIHSRSDQLLTPTHNLFKKSKTNGLSPKIKTNHILPTNSEIQIEQPFETKEAEYTQLLTQNTNSTNLELIFYSSFDGFDPRDFRNKVACHSKMIFLFVTKQQDIFGFYQEDVIPTSSVNSVLNVTSHNFFLVGQKNKWESPSFLFRSPKCMACEDKSFTLHDDRSPLFLSCFSAFWVRKSGDINFNLCFKDYYLAANSSKNPLTGRAFSDHLKCDKVIALKCN